VYALVYVGVPTKVQLVTIYMYKPLILESDLEMTCQRTCCLIIVKKLLLTF
jgi:hypothetical protein